MFKRGDMVLIKELTRYENDDPGITSEMQVLVGTVQQIKDVYRGNAKWYYIEHCPWVFDQRWLEPIIENNIEIDEMLL